MMSRLLMVVLTAATRVQCLALLPVAVVKHVLCPALAVDFRRRLRVWYFSKNDKKNLLDILSLYCLGARMSV